MIFLTTTLTLSTTLGTVLRSVESTEPRLRRFNALTAQPDSRSPGASAVATQDEDFSACIEWFRQNLAKVAKQGKVTLKDFKHAARVLDVSSPRKLRPH